MRQLSVRIPDHTGDTQRIFSLSNKTEEQDAMSFISTIASDFESRYGQKPRVFCNPEADRVMNGFVIFDGDLNNPEDVLNLDELVFMPAPLVGG